MTKLVETIKKIIPSKFWVSSISDKNVKIDVSREKEKKLVVRFNPNSPNFENVNGNQISSPDFLFASNHPTNSGRLFVIELSAGRDKTRKKLEAQLSSGFAQLEECMKKNNVSSFKPRPKVRALYFGNMNSRTRREIKKHPLKIKFLGRSIQFEILERGSGLDEVP